MAKRAVKKDEDEVQVAKDAPVVTYDKVNQTVTLPVWYYKQLTAKQTDA